MVRLAAEECLVDRVELFQMADLGWWLGVIRRCGIEARFLGGGASGGQDGARPRGQRQCAHHAHLAAWLERHRDPARRHLIVGAAGAGHGQARGRAHRVRVPGLRLRLRPGDALRGRPRRVQLPP
jgi:hypothetical protein